MVVSYQARIVFPVDRAPIENGVVTVDGGRIVEVGTAAGGGRVVDLGDAALLPGLVNAHTHLEFSQLRRPMGGAGMSLPDWIRLVIGERGRGDRSREESLANGVAESLRAGVTTVGDISTCSAAAPLGCIDAVRFHEVIGFSRARAESALAAALERMDGAEDHQAAFGISPHAPYTVSPPLLGQLVRLARERDMPMAMHLAESPEELEFLASGTGPFQKLLDERSMWDSEAVPRGSLPLDYLRALAEAPRALVIHGNYLSGEELDFIGERRARMSLVYCPRTHAYFGHEPYPLARAISAGARVALGTDSRASNPDLSLLEEMRFVARAYPTISYRDVLVMGTLAGAEALGHAEDVGSISPGKLANMIAMPLPPASDKAAHALEAILFSDVQPSHVWVRGQPLAVV